MLPTHLLVAALLSRLGCNRSRRGEPVQRHISFLEPYTDVRGALIYTYLRQMGALQDRLMFAAVLHETDWGGPRACRQSGRYNSVLFKAALRRIAE